MSESVAVKMPTNAPMVENSSTDVCEEILETFIDVSVPLNLGDKL